LPAAADPAGPPVRDAATVVLLRRGPGGPQVLMGQRGAGAAFMPDKFVFPGGAVDPDDIGLIDDPALDPETARRLAVDAAPEIARALPLAGIRELWEETGLMLGRPDPAATGLPAPAAWRGFFAAGLVPHSAALRLIFRAVTPPGRPRRFDARFFVADAAELAGGHDDLSAAGTELRHLQWLDLAAARALALPFITEVVLAEVQALAAEPGAVRPVPYFRHGAEGSHFRLL
jgi:8-oxo-dGTP pyrophosphatase MutT (NUDIX family)